MPCFSFHTTPEMDEAKGAENEKIFLGKADRFEGVTVRSDKEYCDPTEFAKKLEGGNGMVID